jgi:hypothetical protein
MELPARTCVISKISNARFNVILVIGSVGRVFSPEGSREIRTNIEKNVYYALFSLCQICIHEFTQAFKSSITAVFVVVRTFRVCKGMVSFISIKLEFYTAFLQCLF